jgi:hypothetical protein
MTMHEQELRLDGNAAAGLLQDVFVMEVTNAHGACAGCGAVGEVGAQHLYMTPMSPGAVLRCVSCGTVLIVIVQTEGRVRLGLQGLVWLEMQDAAAAGSA